MPKKRWVFIIISIAGINTMYASDLITIVTRPDSDAVNHNYIGNRVPLVYSPFIKLPPGAVKPQSWLLKQLQLQADGLHGHLYETSKYLDKKNSAWLSKDGTGEHGWEETPYWLKGFSNTGYVLNDKRIIDESRVWIDAIINSRQSDGWFGPSAQRSDLWPKILICWIMQDYYEYSNDPRVLDFLAGFFKYLQSVPEDQFLNSYWQMMRGGDLLYSVYWLYNRTGDESLLELAKKVHRKTARWDHDVINYHCVNMAQAFREPAIHYLQTANSADLFAAQRNWLKIYRLFGQVPGGMFGGDEIARPGYSDPRQASETCAMVEMMLSTEIMLRISGDPIWADRCEDVAFNSFPAALTADYMALRSMTAPNLVVSDSSDKKPELFDSGVYSYLPHGYYCCEHNFGHGWPYFTENLWQATSGDGLAAVLYSPCQVTAKVAVGRQVTIVEKTRYPFEEKVEFQFQMDKPVSFPLYLRIPGWCKNPQIELNGNARKLPANVAGFICITRKWQNSDKLCLILPMHVSIRRWKENKDSISVDRGPLTYSLLIKEKYVQRDGTKKSPGLEIYPQSPWNYGLVVDKNNMAGSFEVCDANWPADNQPFTPQTAPILIKAKTKKIPLWCVDKKNLVGLLQQSPVCSDEPLETVTLIPMGAARLRLSAFPTIGTGPDARQWIAQNDPLPELASHIGTDGTVGAIWNGVEPRSSNDHSALRFTWWPQTGSTEWIEYPFETIHTISSISIYWLDDTGEGQFRVPASWRLLYKTGDNWHEVKNPSAYGVKKDQYNNVTFEPVKTDVLRVEAQLSPGHSGGVVQMKVNN